MVSPQLTGLLAIAAACIIWGVSGYYYKLLDHVPALELLAHRSVWSLAFFLILLTVQKRLPLLWQTLTHREELRPLIVAAVVISLNWLGFIVSIHTGHAVEASLGYYIFPLVAVLLGRIVLGESLTRNQLFAVAMAAVAVVIITMGLGVPPWVSLFLAVTFAIYGLMKKQMSTGPVLSVAAEVVILFPITGGWLLYTHHTAEGGRLGQDAFTTLMLIGSGVMTGLPLFLFSVALKKLRMSTVGLMQYINPSLQLIVAVAIFAEPLHLPHMIALPVIWAALALYSFESIRQEQRARRASKSGSTSS